MDKRLLIITSAKSLFIEKGINSTTISQIATSAGIAKGSVYSFFNSKDEIVEAIFEEEITRSNQVLASLLNTANADETLFEQFIQATLELALDGKSFQQVLLTDGSFKLSPSLMEMVQRYRSQSRIMQVNLLDKVFGSTVEDWQSDLVCILDGLIMEYSTYLTLDDIDINLNDCSKLIAFVVRRAVAGLVQETELTPVLVTQNERAEGTNPQRWITDMQELVKGLPEPEIRLTEDKLILLEKLLNKGSQLFDNAADLALAKAITGTLPNSAAWLRNVNKMNVYLDGQS